MIVKTASADDVAVVDETVRNEGTFSNEKFS